MLDVNESQPLRAEELFIDFKYLYFSGFQNSINISHLHRMKELMGPLQSGFLLPCSILLEIFLEDNHSGNNSEYKFSVIHYQCHLLALTKIVTLTSLGVSSMGHCNILRLCHLGRTENWRASQFFYATGWRHWSSWSHIPNIKTLEMKELKNSFCWGN